MISVTKEPGPGSASYSGSVAEEIKTSEKVEKAEENDEALQGESEAAAVPLPADTKIIDQGQAVDLKCGEGMFKTVVDPLRTPLPNGDCAQLIRTMEYITAAHVKVYI